MTPRNGVGRRGELTLAGSCCVVVGLVAAAAAWLSRAACWLATRRILTLAFVPFSLVSLSSGALRDVFVGAIGAVGSTRLEARGSRRSFGVLVRHKGAELHGRALAVGEVWQKAKRQKVQSVGLQITWSRTDGAISPSRGAEGLMEGHLARPG